MKLSKENILKPKIGPKIGLFYQMASHVVNAKEKLFFFILIFLEYSCFTMLCYVLLYSKVNQLCIHILLLFSR